MSDDMTLDDLTVVGIDGIRRSRASTILAELKGQDNE